MRAGRLDREITLQRFTAAVEDAGTPILTWADIATMRAQIVQQSTDEFIRGAGAVDETVIVFRLRWFDGITPADRVLFEGRHFNIKEVREIGRRRGLELRCLVLESDP